MKLIDKNLIENLVLTLALLLTASTIRRKRICFRLMWSPIFQSTMMLTLSVSSPARFSLLCQICR